MFEVGGIMKLYWRIKKNGKWTWRPVKEHCSDCHIHWCFNEKVFCETQKSMAFLSLQEEE